MKKKSDLYSIDPATVERIKDSFESIDSRLFFNPSTVDPPISRSEEIRRDEQIRKKVRLEVDNTFERLANAERRVQELEAENNRLKAQIDKTVSKNEHDEYLKVIGVLTLALAETKRTYKKGNGTINKSVIVASVQSIIDFEGFDARWKSQSKLYEIINNALDALEKSN